VIDLETLGRVIIALAALYRGRPIVIIIDGDKVEAGILGLDLDRDDWLIAPGPVETLAKAS
jgi:hypothetical protein